MAEASHPVRNNVVQVSTQEQRMMNKLFDSVSQMESRLSSTDANLLVTKQGLDEFSDKLDSEVQVIKSMLTQLTKMGANDSRSDAQEVEHSVNLPETRNDSVNHLVGASFRESMASIATERSRESLIAPQPLPSFDGNPEKAATWLREYEMACTLNWWKDAEMIRGVGRCFSGDAKNWLLHRYMPDLTSGSVTWLHFKEEFCKAYFRNSDRLRLYDKIRNYNQKDERLSAFFNSMVALCHDYDPDMGEKDIITHFTRGVKSNYRSVITMCCFLKPNCSLKELECAIRQMEDEENWDRLRHINDRSGRWKFSKTSNKVTSQSQATDVQDNTTTASTESNVSNRIICYNCLKLGHRVGECDQPKDVSRIKMNAQRLQKRKKKVVGVIEEGEIQTRREETCEWNMIPESIHDGKSGDPGESSTSLTEDELCDLYAQGIQINHVGKNKIQGPNVDCVIKGRFYKAQVDTGAYTSVMSEKIRDELELPIIALSDTLVKMANEAIEVPVGWVEADVKFKNIEMKIKFLVLKNVTNILIGNDFLENHRALIDYGNRKCQLFPSVNHIGCYKEIPTIANIVEEFDDVFAKDRADVGCIHDAVHSINTGDCPPIQQRYYRVTPWEKEVIDGLLEEMLTGGIVVESKSPWSSPAVLVAKKDHHTRFCIDYRKLNAVTLDDPYPIPRIEDALDLLEGCRYFSALDVAAMYWHVKLSPEDQVKTAFIIPQGLFEFTRMPFGLKNAPATAARIMNKVLAGLNYVDCFIYFDDIIIFGRTKEEHDTRLKKVLTRLREYNVKLRQHKCDIGKESIDYLGYHISHQGISPSENNIASVLAIKKPNNVGSLRRFLGLCSYFRRFIKNFASLAQPLYALLKKDAKWVWNEKQSSCFAELKGMITRKPVLACYRTEGAVEVHTDACDHGIGAILYQEQENGEMKPVSYISRSLKSAEKNYGITEKECLAIVWSLQYLRHYLYGRTFVVITDHCGLCWFMSNGRVNSRLTRWSIKLQEFSFVVKYRSGKLHEDADCISRDSIEVENDHENLGTTSSVKSVEENDKIRHLQKSDEFCIKTCKLLDDSSLSKRKKNRLRKKFTIHDGIVYRCRGKSLLPVIPKDLQIKILEEMHKGSLGGHFGMSKTYEKLKIRVYWQNMMKDVRNFVRSCHDCQVRKPYLKPAKGFLIPIKVSCIAFQDISLDLLEMPLSESGFRYVVVINDRLTKIAVAEAIKTCTSHDIITVLYDSWILKFGTPLTLITDQGPNLMSEEFQSFLLRCNIKHTPTTPYHPQCDGQTERFNAYLGDVLAIYSKNHPQLWDLHLAEVLFAYNTTPHTSTKVSPFFLAFGQEARLPIEGELNIQRGWTQEDDRLDSLRDARRIAAETINKAQQISKKYYDEKKMEANFKVNDLVVLKTVRLKKGKNKKFINRYKGPYKICRRLSPVTYEIVNLRGRQSKNIVHCSKLKPYHEYYSFKLSADEEEEAFDDFGALLA